MTGEAPGTRAIRPGRTLLTAAILFAALPASAGTRQNSTVITPQDEASATLFDQFGFSEAVVTPDGTVYMSGVVAGLGEDGDFEAAYRRAFVYMTDVLARAGADWDDVVDITSFHTDLTSQLAPMGRVKADYIEAPYPAWTAIQIDRLFPDRGITEIKLIAKIAPANDR